MSAAYQIAAELKWTKSDSIILVIIHATHAFNVINKSCLFSTFLAYWLAKCCLN